MKFKQNKWISHIGKLMVSAHEQRASLYVNGHSVNQKLWETLWDKGEQLKIIYDKLKAGRKPKMKSEDKFAHIHFCVEGCHWWLHEGDAKCHYLYTERDQGLETDCVKHKKVKRYPRLKTKFPRFYHRIKRCKSKNGIVRYARVAR